MQDPRNSDYSLPIALPNMGASSTPAILPEEGRTEVQEEDGRFLMDEQQLGGGNLPCKNLVDALALPSTIGTAVAAGALFTLMFTESSMESSDYRFTFNILALSGFLFALATAITIFLQALYSSPSFCKILYKKLNPNQEFRTKFEPWPSWDFMRYIVAYFTVAFAFTSLFVHITATMLIFKLFTFNGHVFPAQLTFGLACGVCVVIWIISIVLERPQRLRGEDISPAASSAIRTRNRSGNQSRA
ncbi:hypothetical protein M407DRAFT_19316 [Tulasnella calospora MUT 4182]|uniref:Uncharacterized protein n=1 Tax=Tulasnella calospora MUT 4182 TaxID=1051891 RepID=A0A0C3QSB0_9AGAM|nr:hypothetical protein M407DRAFT_19316 [Tulasnella calospora MUT 4182]